MQKKVQFNQIPKIAGIVPITMGAFFIYFVNANFKGDYFVVSNIMFSLMGLGAIFFGVYILLSKTEFIYDEEVIEKKTTFLGMSWSHKIDRALVRDIGPVAAGLVRKGGRVPFLE